MKTKTIEHLWRSVHLKNWKLFWICFSNFVQFSETLWTASNATSHLLPTFWKWMFCQLVSISLDSFPSPSFCKELKFYQTMIRAAFWIFGEFWLPSLFQRRIFHSIFLAFSTLLVYTVFLYVQFFFPPPSFTFSFGFESGVGIRYTDYLHIFSSFWFILRKFSVSISQSLICSPYFTL